MSFFSRIFGRSRKTPAMPQESVTFDDARISRTLPDGRQESVQWSELVKVSIVTTGEGPFADDVIWVLSGTDTGCLVPSGADGAEELLARLQQLPGFDNEAVIKAMGSVENAEFVCWTKAGGSQPQESPDAP